jgi:short chain dehydrogenase
MQYAIIVEVNLTRLDVEGRRPHMDPQPDGSVARARKLWHGHTAVITGAGSGIGAGMARAAAGLGMTVVLADVDEDRMSQVASRIHRAGGRAVVVPTDVTSLPAVEHLADVAFGDVGGVCLVANNAGVGHVGLLWEEPVHVSVALPGPVDTASSPTPTPTRPGAPSSRVSSRRCARCWPSAA